MSADPARRLLAEAIGTGILVLFGAGSVVAALTLGNGRLDYAGLGMVAITFALAIALAIYAFGNTSGAHLNAAVTVSLAAVGRFPWSEVPTYIGAQLAGLGEDDRFQRTEALSAHIGKEVPVAWDVQSSKPAARRASFQLA
jgi:glycerol uptake facilitator protein